MPPDSDIQRPLYYSFVDIKRLLDEKSVQNFCAKKERVRCEWTKIMAKYVTVISKKTFSLILPQNGGLAKNPTPNTQENNASHGSKDMSRHLQSGICFSV